MSNILHFEQVPNTSATVDLTYLKIVMRKNFKKFEKPVKTFIQDYFIFTSIISDQIRSTFVAYFW